MEKMSIIGRVEKVSFPELGIKNVHAKVDTGADTSTIWATGIHEEDGVLKFKLFGKSSSHFSGKEIEVLAPNYLLTRIANSFGDRELRYVVKLQIKIGGKLVRASFTLSNRSKKTYPILIGRQLLNKKFIVDVSKGSPLSDIEQQKKVRMKKELEIYKMWEKKV